MNEALILLIVLCLASLVVATLDDSDPSDPWGDE